MKKLFIFGVLVSLFVLLAVGGNAALTVSDVTLGSSTQKRGETVSGTLTLTNSGTTKLEGLTVLSSTLTNTKYDDATEDLFGSLSLTDLDPGQVANLPVTLFVPLDFNSANDLGVKKEFEVGTVTLTATDLGADGLSGEQPGPDGLLGAGLDGVLGTADDVASEKADNVNDDSAVQVTGKLSLKAENKLRLRDGDAVISGLTTRTKSFRDGSRVDNLKPGDTVELKFELENDFPDSGNNEVDFDDVDVSLDITADEDFDIDDDSDSFSLNADERDTVTFILKVEDDAQDRTHTMTVVATAVDENGAQHGDTWQVTLEVERDSHDLAIRELSLSPDKLLCGANQRTVKVNADVLNRGRSNERNAAFEARVSSLGLVERVSDFKIDEDDTERVQLSFTVPTDAPAGKHDVDFFTLYDNSRENNVRTVSLTVEECKVKLPEPVDAVKPAEPKEPVVQVPPGVTTQPAQSTVLPTARVRSASQFTESGTYLVLLGVAVGVVAVLILALLAVLVKRR